MSHRQRLINSIKRNAPWLDDENLLDFLEAIGPLWLLNQRNIGWASVAEVNILLMEHGRINEDIRLALRRHNHQDQFKLKNGSWV